MRYAFETLNVISFCTLCVISTNDRSNLYCKRPRVCDALDSAKRKQMGISISCPNAVSVYSVPSCGVLVSLPSVVRRNDAQVPDATEDTELRGITETCNFVFSCVCVCTVSCPGGPNVVAVQLTCSMICVSPVSGTVDGALVTSDLSLQSSPNLVMRGAIIPRSGTSS